MASNSTCVTCPAHSSWDSESQNCPCNPGFNLDAENACLSVCTANADWEYNECQCIPGYFMASN